MLQCRSNPGFKLLAMAWQPALDPSDLSWCSDGLLFPVWATMAPHDLPEPRLLFLRGWSREHDSGVMLTVRVLDQQLVPSQQQIAPSQQQDAPSQQQTALSSGGAFGEGGQDPTAIWCASSVHVVLPNVCGRV